MSARFRLALPFIAALALLAEPAAALRVARAVQPRMDMLSRKGSGRNGGAGGARKKPAPYVPAGRLARGGLPEEVFQMTNFATGGSRTPNTVAEIEMNWKAFRSCFSSEKLAVEAAKKNSAVFSPQFSNPKKIKGTYSLLVKRIGKKETAALLQKNPGVLCNSPAGLAKCTDKEILDAAELVATLDANKPVINALAGLVLLLVIAAAIYRTVTVNPTGYIAGYN